MNEFTVDELRQRLQDRLEILQREHELGEQRLRAVEQESLSLRQTLLRIGGAIQVLNEILQAGGSAQHEDQRQSPEPVPSGSG